MLGRCRQAKHCLSTEGARPCGCMEKGRWAFGHTCLHLLQLALAVGASVVDTQLHQLPIGGLPI